MEEKKIPDISIPIIWPEDKEFEHARVNRLFNHRRPSRLPLAVVIVSSEEDIKEAIRLAKTLDSQVSVRSGGHSWAAWSVRDNAILIDLVQLNSISYDDSTAIVTVGPATTGERLNSFLNTKGRMFNGPHCPSVALGGFL
jgi:FAD/FMN-containing dehydrogenase